MARSWRERKVLRYFLQISTMQGRRPCTSNSTRRSTRNEWLNGWMMHFFRLDCLLFHAHCKKKERKKRTGNKTKLMKYMFLAGCKGRAHHAAAFFSFLSFFFRFVSLFRSVTNFRLEDISFFGVISMDVVYILGFFPLLSLPVFPSMFPQFHKKQRREGMILLTRGWLIIRTWHHTTWALFSHFVKWADDWKLFPFPLLMLLFYTNIYLNLKEMLIDMLAITSEAACSSCFMS